MKTCSHLKGVHSAPMQKFWFLGNKTPELIQTKFEISEI